MANPKLLPKLLRPLPKSILDPKKKNCIVTAISSRKETASQRSAYNNRRGKPIFYSNRSRKYRKNISKPQIIIQITTAAAEVKYCPQEAKVGAI